MVSKEGGLHLTESCFQKWLEEQRKRYEAPPESLRKETPLWHGTRRLEKKEWLKEEGFCTFDCRSAFWEVVKALKHFNKMDKLSDERILDQLSEACRFEKDGLWVDAESEEQQREWGRQEGKPISKAPRTCSYATRGPEIVSLTLAHAGVGREEAMKYIRETYGKPYAVKLKGKMPLSLLNMPTGCRCFEPDDIEEVYECPEEEKK
jgi:hypothetical protein